MALYAFDGTGKQDEEDESRDSNVVDFFNAYTDPKKNVDPGLKEGVNTYAGHCTYEAVATAQNIPYSPLDRLI